MLELAKIELKRRSKSIPIIVLICLLISIPLAINLTSLNFNSIYSANIPIDGFTVTKNPDVYVSGNIVFVKDTAKSYSAFDKLREIIRREYDTLLYERYGENAFPVLVKVHKIPTKPVKISNLKKQMPIKPAKKVTVKKAVEKRASKEKSVTARITSLATHVTSLPKRVAEREGYILPEELKPPILFEKIVYAFAVLLPFYFISQIFSSSFMEDKLRGRIEVILTAIPDWRYFAGKLLPYSFLTIILSLLIAILFKNPAIFLITLSIGLLMISIDAFIVFISRSYKELSFISIVVSLVITVYLLLPAVFSFIPSLSPVSVLMRCIEGEKVDLSMLISSSSHLLIMTGILMLITSKSFEFMHDRSLLRKIIDVTARINDGYHKTFIFTTLSIPFVLLAELFLIAAIFPLRNYYIPLLLALAIVEEFFKGLFIYTASMNNLNPVISALLSATGFFIGEKFVLFRFVPSALAILFILPLLAHVISALIFALTMKLGFKKALAFSSSTHAIYNGLIIWMLLR